jgi:hypothetical protein
MMKKTKRRKSIVATAAKSAVGRSASGPKKLLMKTI